MLEIPTLARSGLSAEIARAYAEAYLTDQLDSKYDATRGPATGCSCALPN